MRRETSEGEGACLSLFADRSHLPLRGKLGWMTPRAGVKTTPAIETRLPGPPDPKRGPLLFAILPQDPKTPSRSLIHSARNGDARLAQHMRHLRLAQA